MNFVFIYLFVFIFLGFTMNKFLLLGIALTGGALLLGIVGTAIPYWWSSDHTDIGLFRLCTPLRLVGYTCLEYTGK